MVEEKLDQEVKYLKVTWPIFVFISSAAEVSPYQKCAKIEKYKFRHSRYYLVFYSHINAISSLYIPWFNSSKLDSCLLVTKKRRVMVDMYCLKRSMRSFLFFHSAMLSKASPLAFLSFCRFDCYLISRWRIPTSRLLFNFKMANFYVISISQIGTNRWSSGTNRKHVGMKK